MRIGELARQAGVDVQTIRYYEREGLLEAPARTAGGYRAYGPAHLERLNFVRQESASCSEMVLLPAFNKSVNLPEGQTVPVEFMPSESGEYEFACQMGMFRGRIIVE